jgi:hypothetical protein
MTACLGSSGHPVRIEGRLRRSKVKSHRDDHRDRTIVLEDHPLEASIDSSPKARRKRTHERSTEMRGLLMALFAFDFPGHGVHPLGGRERASFRSTKATAKATAKTV